MSDQSDKPGTSETAPDTSVAAKEKTFANLHYPGMRADPNEGRETMHANARWRFAPQIACIGEEAQKKLLMSSVFVATASPLGVAIAKKFIQGGFGRVGVFGDEVLSGACALEFPEDNRSTATLPALAAWARKHAPWVEFETFREASVDRSLSDMARGFALVVSAGCAQIAGQAVSVARETGMPAMAAYVTGRQGWCASIGANTVCEDCLAVPDLGEPESPGLYYPLLDFAATWISALAIDSVLGHTSRSAFVESIDATRSPWLRDTREAAPRPGCLKCSPAK
ncbi:MAG: hypothetical protein HY074_02495 [Deltaproteobacteria bacterium]|nr:hypothetical protein [Deltaproteobacteria bacterium]